MRPDRFGVARVLAAGVLFARGCDAFGQESIRSSIAGEAAVRARREALLQAPHTIDLGAAKALITGGVSAEYNSNINLVETNPTRDLVLKPSVGVSLTWPVSSSTVLESSLGLSYWKYASHASLDRLRLQPGSGLNFDFFLKDVRVRLRDEVSYTDDPVAQGAISGTPEYGMFLNDSGVSFDWDLNRFLLNVGYDHTIARSTRHLFNYLDRNSDSVSLRPALRFGSGSQIGLELGVGWNAYRRNLLGDSSDLNAGVFTSLALSTSSQLVLRGGSSTYRFDESSSGFPSRTSSSYYVSLRLDQKVSAHVSHTLEVGKDIQLGINSELISLWRVRDQVSWRLFRHTRLDGMFFFESGDETGRSVLAAPESYSRIGGELGVAFEVSRHGDIRFDVQATFKGSAIPLRDYDQIRTSVGYAYHF